MKTRRLVLSFVAVAALSLAAAAQIWSGIPQFSADMKMSGARGQEMTGKMYFGGQRMRYEMNAGGHEMISIHDAKTQTSYMIMPQQKMYMEMNANAMRGMGRGPRMPDAKAFDPNNPCANEEGYTCKKVGSETVNGRSCDKWEFTGKEGTRTVWLDQKLHFPIKMVGNRGDTFELTNVQEGSQPASLFEVPAGFTKMDMGGMMMGRPQAPPQD